MTATQSSYRWIIAVAAAVMLALSMGLLANGLLPFVVSLEAEFERGRGEFARINTFGLVGLGLVGLGLGGIVMGRVADQIGIRRVVLTGAIVTGLTVLAASQARSLWQLFALFLPCRRVRWGSTFRPVMALVRSRFRTGAGPAIGVVAAAQAARQGWAVSLLPRRC